MISSYDGCMETSALNLKRSKGRVSYWLFQKLATPEGTIPAPQEGKIKQREHARGEAKIKVGHWFVCTDTVLRACPTPC